MDSALTLMQAFSINETINWASFRSRWRQEASAAQTYAQTYPFIQRALSELDPHSGLSTPQNLPGSTDAPVDRPDLRVQTRMVASRVGYIWIPGFVGRSQAGRVDTTHAALRDLETNNPCGWIVDLRANSGGFFYGLMASVGPLYAPTPSTVGGQRYNGGYQELWYYRQRTNGTDVFGVRNARDSAEFVIQNPWRPRRPGLPVAVLHSTARNAQGQLTSITASAGESITLAFRGGVPTRSFGAPTYGVASGRAFFFMPDSARIDITDSYMFDRRGFTPGNDPIPVDTAIASPAPLRIAAVDDVVGAAIKWLEARPECAAGGAALSRSRMPEYPASQLVPSLPDGPRRVPGTQAVYAPW